MKFSIQDATLAAAYSQLAASALGLSSIWIGMFDEEKVKEDHKNRVKTYIKYYVLAIQSEETCKIKKTTKRAHPHSREKRLIIGKSFGKSR